VNTKTRFWHRVYKLLRNLVAVWVAAVNENEMYKGVFSLSGVVLGTVGSSRPSVKARVQVKTFPTSPVSEALRFLSRFKSASFQ
jgi:hypothetical protein